MYLGCRVLVLLRVHMVVVIEAGLLPLWQAHRWHILVTQSLQNHTGGGGMKIYPLQFEIAASLSVAITA